MRKNKTVQKITNTSCRSTSDRWPVAYRWAAMGTLVAYSAIGTQTINTAYAQEKPLPNAIQIPAQVRRFDIPASPLDSVLAAFQSVTGIEVSVTVEQMGNVSSPGVSGTYTPEQALEKLLAGTGLAYRFTTPTAVKLSVKSVSSSIDVVTSVESLSTTTPKYTQAILDTPQTISTVSQATIQQQGTTTLRDALRNVAGISLAAGEGGAQGDNLTIRGFAARNDLFIDGMRDFGSYYRDPFNTQEVEVLQGPSSVTFGRGSTGGVVNQATKSPRLSKFITADAAFGTDLTRRGAVDIDLPIPQLGKGAAFRLNVMGQQNEVAGRDIAENRRYGIAPSLAVGLGTATRLNLAYFHQNADDTPDYGIPWLFNQPAPVNRRNYYGFRNDNYLRTNDDIGTARLEHDFNSNLTLRTQARYARYHRDVLITEARVAATVTPATPVESISVTRGQIGALSDETYLVDQVDLTARFRTGFLQHAFVTGFEAGRETSDPTRPTWTGVPGTSLLSPDTNQSFAGTSAITSRVQANAVSVSAYALDTIHLDKHWDLTGGVRVDRFDSSYKQLVAPLSSFSRVDNMTSWRAALVYKPVGSASIYVSAGTSFNPSAESLALTAGTANLSPEKNKTYEAGAKWDLAAGRLSLRSAFFRTDKLNARETDPTNSLLVVLSGNQRVDGAQFEIRGRLTSRWDILSSYAYLDGHVESSRFFPASIGAQLANVPRNTFNLWTNYRFPRQWQTGFGGNYVDSRTASSTVPLDPSTGLVKQAPSYWVFNAMASHPIVEHIDFQVNVNNIANRYYYDQLHPGHVILGAGRSALVGLKFKF